MRVRDSKILAWAIGADNIEILCDELVNVIIDALFAKAFATLAALARLNHHIFAEKAVKKLVSLDIPNFHIFLADGEAVLSIQLAELDMCDSGTVSFGLVDVWEGLEIPVFDRTICWAISQREVLWIEFKGCDSLIWKVEALYDTISA